MGRGALSISPLLFWAPEGHGLHYLTGWEAEVPVCRLASPKLHLQVLIDRLPSRSPDVVLSLGRQGKSKAKCLLEIPLTGAFQMIALDHIKQHLCGLWIVRNNTGQRYKMYQKVQDEKIYNKALKHRGEKICPF